MASVVARRVSRVVAIAVLGISVTHGASAYVGPSFIQVPGADGGWQGADYKNWFKVDGNYWHGRSLGIQGMGRGRNLYSGPYSPREGAGKLVIAIDKNNPVLQPLMDTCLKKTPIAELTYAESSERARVSGEIGLRPTNIPAYYEYKLRDVTFSDCPVVTEAPQQAIVISFNNIERLNYAFKESGVDTRFEPKNLQPAPHGPTTKSFVITWFAVAHDISDDQCSRVNDKPSEADYYALVPKAEAEKERKALGEKGVSYLNGQMGFRGPSRLNVTMLPGIVKDPGNAEPHTKIARGLDLDGDDGSGAPPAGVCKHENFASADGRKGIDNQLYRVQGCTPSFMGHKGFIQQFNNGQRRDGGGSPLIQITGIDNEKNDDSVEVALLWSQDPMAKNGAGDQALPDYTFRLTDEPRYTHFFRKLKGRIENGVVITERVKELDMSLGGQLFEAGLRLELLPNGNIIGVVGGYKDWRDMVSTPISSQAEQVHNYQLPATYNAYRRHADGLKDPISGECNGISSASDIEGIPAFILPAQRKGEPKVAQATNN